MVQEVAAERPGSMGRMSLTSVTTLETATENHSHRKRKEGTNEKMSQVWEAQVLVH